MNSRNQRLLLEQVESKVKPYIQQAKLNNPEEGWIYTIRKALNMSLRQIAQKLEVTPQAVKALEQREKNGSITLNSLKEVAGVMHLQLVYALVPKDGSLSELVQKKAMELAKEIVDRAAQTMALEDQSNRKDRLIKALDDKTTELINEMPKNLWD